MARRPVARLPPDDLRVLSRLFAEFEGAKEIHVDLRLEDERQREFQLEMQIRSRGAFDERMLDNWARIFTSQLAKGDSYGEHRETVSLWIIKQDHFRDNRWLHAFEARDLPSGRVLSPSFLIITVELDAWSRLRTKAGGDIVVEEGLVRWLTLLSEGESLDPGNLPESLADADLREALDIMAEFTVKEKERYLYERRLDFERARISELNEARDEGITEGIGQGLAKGLAQGHAEGRAEGHTQGLAEGARRKALETARRLKEMGMDLAGIAKVTGLSEDEAGKA